MKLHRFNWFCILVLVTLLIAALAPAGSAFAQDGRTASVIPVLKAPVNTIVTRTPTYTWTKVLEATNYRYQVYQGTALLMDMRIPARICGKSACSQKSTFALKNENYKWRVRARVAGVWMPWSEYAVFFVSAPSFTSGFNGSMTGWKSQGSVNWSVLPTKVITHGKFMKWASLYRTTGTFSDFIYSARVKRINPNGSSCLAFRMGAQLGSFYNDWHPGYLFCLGEDWQYTVIRCDSPGAYTTLYKFSPSTSIVVDDWNELTLVARADTFIFYINHVKVASVKDDTYNCGSVGFTMFNDSSLFTTFMVDWVKLSALLKETDFEMSLRSR